MADAPRDPCELDHLAKNPGRRGRRTITTARGGAAKQGILDGTARLGIEPLEGLTDERPELLGVERAECSHDIAIAIGLGPQESMRPM